MRTLKFITNQLKIGDYLLIGCLLVTASVYIFHEKMHLWGNSGSVGEPYAIISVDGKPDQTVELTEEERYIEISTSRGYDRLRVRNNGIEVVKSDCPEKICFTYGLIQKPGETIICLPLRMVVTIKSTGKPVQNQVDAVVN
ncbi:NusG domain II-containing protein [Gorillibacterium massiliense]|uniref:NusG domain II-containing protein n=1 Tax=Gorillibacterium massiliense TaxID=1280390 RepID=UPI0004B9DCDD|nr:NusG domain II-containing protein [Gorillibacterium massiliense]